MERYSISRSSEPCKFSRLSALTLSRNPDLPFETRNVICLDVARGLEALHTCGVIHGDIKPDNILMFHGSRWRAKIADFSHSIIDTGEPRHLPGGTAGYAAPEWQDLLSPAGQYKSDIYSYGVLFGSVVVGQDVTELYLKNPMHGRTPHERALGLETRKVNDSMKDYIMDLLYDRNDNDLTARRDDLAVIEAVLDLTVQSDPDKRHLGRVIAKLRKWVFCKSNYRSYADISIT